MELAVGAALVLAHDPDRPEAHLGIAADGPFVRAAGSVVIQWWPHSENRYLASSATASRPRPGPASGAEVDVDPGVPNVRLPARLLGGRCEQASPTSPALHSGWL